MNKKTEAFTIIELLVGIAIIALIIVSASKINFNYTNNEQKLEIFSNSIKSEIERVRNNSLVGKGVSTDIIKPSKWKIDFSSGDTGKILTSYTLSTEDIIDSADWIEENELSMPNNFSIKEINCYNNIVETKLSDTEIGTIIFNLGEYVLDGECLGDKDMIISTSYYNTTKYSQNIKFNSINGLITEE